MSAPKEPRLVPSQTTALLQSIRQWLLAAVFLLGIEIVTLAHVGYVQNATRILYWQSLVFSVAGVLGGVVAAIAVLKILGNYSQSAPDGPLTE